jgi:hypothetical protein
MYWFFAVRNRCIGREGNEVSKERRRSKRLREKGKLKRPRKDGGGGRGGERRGEKIRKVEEEKTTLMARNGY